MAGIHMVETVFKIDFCCCVLSEQDFGCVYHTRNAFMLHAVAA